MKFFDYDPYTGIREDIGKDDSGKVVIKRTADVQNRFDANTREKLNAKSGWKEDFHKVASIPWIVVQQWREELIKKGAPDPNPLAKINRPFLTAKLNNRDNSKLRTKDGNL